MAKTAGKNKGSNGNAARGSVTMIQVGLSLDMLNRSATRGNTTATTNISARMIKDMDIYTDAQVGVIIQTSKDLIKRNSEVAAMSDYDWAVRRYAAIFKTKDLTKIPKELLGTPEKPSYSIKAIMDSNKGITDNARLAKRTFERLMAAAQKELKKRK